MCRNCGAIVAGGAAHCGQCEAPVTQRAANVEARHGVERAPDHATMRFAQALFQRPATFTLVFLVANVFMFALTTLAGSLQNPGTLISFGAKVNSLINNDGEWWRFVAPVFLHGNVAHLLMNMYGLWVLGPYVERLYGSAKFVFFWVLTGVAGMVASYLSVQPELAAQGGAVNSFLFKSGDPFTVGASGSLFGLIGVLFVFGIKYRGELPDGFKQAFGTGMLPTILLNIFIGYIIPVIDNAAHLGGLVAGAALALVINYKRIGPRQPVAYFWHGLQAASLLLVVISFAFVAHRYTGPAPSLENFNARDIASPVTDVVNTPAFVEAINGGVAAFARTLTEGDAAAAEAAIKNLDSAPTLDDASTKLRDDLRALLTRAQGLAAAPAPAQGKGAQVRAAQQERERAEKELVADYKAWQGQLREWTEAHGGTIKQVSNGVDGAKETSGDSK
jgi:membrane associated rhomboid family serine protease